MTRLEFEQQLIDQGCEVLTYHDPHQILFKRPNGSIGVEAVNEEPTLTQQHHKADCDINNIMRKYETTGQFTGHIKEGGMYADFTQITDYRDMVDAVRYAQNAFMSLPAHVRKHFDNDPENLLQFLKDPSNYDKALEMGLVDPDIKMQKMAKAQKLNDLNEKLRPKAKTATKMSKDPAPKEPDDSEES